MLPIVSDISRTKLSVMYRVGLTVVAFAMVLLPAVYLALIVLVGWGVLHHLRQNTWIIDSSGGRVFELILYLGPAVVGGVLVFFMLKPLFAKRPKVERPLSLDPAREPLLFAFVQRITRLVGAPMPSRIDVDCQVNASASLRRGWWSRDLVLTIGLPLAAGLDMRQFAGVLAHEFGHFAQGAGMRLTYVIRNVNFWFARVVYERDQWDVSLDRTARSVDLRLGVVLHAARGCVWLTRRILWALMHAGNAISCFMLRQMEFDADSYEAKVAGSDAFESTAARLPLLTVATQIAFDDVRQSWASRRLPENLPLLIQHKAGALPDDVRQKLAAATTATKTKWHDTHPCDTDRVKAARALNEPGVFRVERPATELFADFAETSKAVTRHQYEKHWQLEFSAHNLVPSAEMLRESAANAEAEAAVRRFCGEVHVNLTPLLTSAALPPLLDRDRALAQWRTAREQGEKLRPEAEEASAECARRQQQSVLLTTALHLTAAGFKIEPKEFGLLEYKAVASTQHAAATQALEEVSRAIQQELARLEPFCAALRTRLTCALQLQAGTFAPEPAAELEGTVRALAALGAGLRSVHLMGIRLRAFVVLAQNRGNHSQPGSVDAQLSRLAVELRTLLTEVHAPLAGIPYPFQHPRGQLTIADYARYEKPCESEWESIFQESSACVERLFALHYRLLGRLLMVAEQAEQDLAS